MCSKVTNSVRTSIERFGKSLDLGPARPHYGPWYEMYYLEYRFIIVEVLLVYLLIIITYLVILKFSICNSEFPIKKVSTKSLNQQHYNSSALFIVGDDNCITVAPRKYRWQWYWAATVAL